MKSRNKAFVFGIIALFLIIFIALNLNAIHEYELTGRSIGYLTAAIQLYVNEHDRMPNGYDDLVAVGILSETRIRTVPDGLFGKTAQLPYRIVRRGTPDVDIDYLDNINVDWSVPIKNLQINDNRLVNRRTGESTYIISQTKHKWIFNNHTRDMYYSIILFKSLTDTTNTQPASSDSRSE